MDTLANPPALIGSSDEDKLRRTYETCIKGSHILHFNGCVSISSTSSLTYTHATLNLITRHLEL